MHHGHRIGTLPADFEPLIAKSQNPMYEVRDGDFRREGDDWVAEES
jgi:hypothetical protein